MTTPTDMFTTIIVESIYIVLICTKLPSSRHFHHISFPLILQIGLYLQLFLLSVKIVFNLKVTGAASFWSWMRDTFVPGLYNTTWYNGLPFNYDEGFISNRENFLVGMPRLRQVRIRPGK